jgi:phosphatidylserine/phosphatidylglycerophosphate/cardiolipin synthase-like enzyme
LIRYYKTRGNTVNIDIANTHRTRFGETTTGNCVLFTIDGEENFRLMYEKMRQAKSSIYIANYDLDPDLPLVRGDPRSFQFNLVSSTCKSEQLMTTNSHDISPNNNKNCNNNKFHILQDLLIEKARQKVDIKILVWEPRLIIRKLPGTKKRGLEGREQKVEAIEQIAKDYDLEHQISIRLDSKAPTSTSGFHEKITIIDNQIGFCGGQDFSKDKWDTSNHDFDNPLRDIGGDPWHDVHAMVKGPIVWDLIYHFNQRWVYSIWKDIRQVKKIVNANSIGSYLSSSFPYSQTAALSSTNDGDVEITALRTWKRMDEKNDSNIDDSNTIHSWYDSMFKRAKDSIYIEDQFPFQDKAITQVLVNRLREEEDLKVIIVGPMEPNLPGFIFSIIAKESINDINHNLASLRKAGKNRVRTYSLISQHNRLKERRKQIYVHSKLMIVDDKWITIGSANTDRDGFRDSTEFDLAIVSTTLAQKLRVKLWREHLEVDVTSSSHSDLYDFNDGFKAWEQLADDNGKRIRNNEAIDGHVYHYNFEEMSCPPPYPTAKGGNRFRLV